MGCIRRWVGVPDHNACKTNLQGGLFSLGLAVCLSLSLSNALARNFSLSFSIYSSPSLKHFKTKEGRLPCGSRSSRGGCWDRKGRGALASHPRHSGEHTPHPPPSQTFVTLRGGSFCDPPARGDQLFWATAIGRGIARAPFASVLEHLNHPSAREHWYPLRSPKESTGGHAFLGYSRCERHP